MRRARSRGSGRYPSREGTRGHRHAPRRHLHGTGTSFHHNRGVSDPFHTEPEEIERLLGIVRAALPDVEITSWDVLPGGWDNVAIRLNGTWLARFQRPQALGKL